MKTAASYILYYLGHACYLLCDRGRMAFMCRWYLSCMTKSVELDVHGRLWKASTINGRSE